MINKGTVNITHLTGRLGAEIGEVRETNNGTKVVNFSLATTNQDGSAEWHNITLFGNSAEVLKKHSKKGDSLTLIGRLSTETYEKDGVEMKSTKIIVDSWTFGNGNSKNEAEDNQ